MAKIRVKGFLTLSAIYLFICLFYSNCTVREETHTPTQLGGLDHH
ncbi:hypothetical protein [Bdellovibrio sp. ZAP7]|nr:hypothetical protein [Bdellovibrio sp. ZAP7]